MKNNDIKIIKNSINYRESCLDITLTRYNNNENSSSLF